MKSVLAIILFALAYLVTGIQAYASEIIPDFELPGTGKEIVISAVIPEGFTERIEVYLNGAPRALSFNPELDNMGYMMRTRVEPVIYEVVVLSSTNIDDRYEFIAPETLNTLHSDLLTISVIDTWETGAEAELHEHGNLVFEEIKIQPQVFDFSEGGSYGTMHIRGKTYAAVDSVVYRLVGLDRVYEIVLDREHVFEAEVLLPAGSYYESGSISIVLDADASAIADTGFVWAHGNNPGYFGNYYEVTEGGGITVDDLKIMMTYKGEVEELNSNVLFRSSLMDNYIEAQESHRNKEMETFPDRMSEEETETIAVAESVPESAEQFAFEQIKLMAAVVIFMFLLAVAVLSRRQHTK